MFFHTNVNRWSFTRISVTSSLLKSPGLFLVFWLILIMMSFGWSPLVLLFPSPPIPLSILYCMYQAHKVQLISPSLSFSIVFQFSSKVWCFTFCSFSISFTLWSTGKAKSIIQQVLLAHSVVSSLMLFELICWIRLLCNWSFRLYITT